MNNRERQNYGILLYSDFEEQINLLSDEEAGLLLKSIFVYEREGVCPQLSPVAQMVFISIRQSLDRNLERYKEISEKNRENGKHGGRPAKADNQGEKKPKKRSVISVSENETQKPTGCFENSPETLGFSQKPKKAKEREREREIIKESEIIKEREGVRFGRQAARNSPTLCVGETAEPPGGSAAATDIFSDEKSEKTGRKTKPPRPPTLAEIEEYCYKAMLKIDPAKFFAYYSARNWCHKNGSPITNWQKRADGWNLGEYSKCGPASPSGGHPDPKEAWSLVLESLRKITYTNSVIFPLPAFHYAIQRLGGWSKLCNSNVFDELLLRKKFESVFVEGLEKSIWSGDEGNGQQVKVTRVLHGFYPNSPIFDATTGKPVPQDFLKRIEETGAVGFDISPIIAELASQKSLNQRSLS